MDKIRAAVIGLGGRGRHNLRLVMGFKTVEVNAVCDVYEDRANEGADIVISKGGNKPFVTTDYIEAISREDVNTVLVFTSWRSHIEIAIEAMNRGLAVGIEVGGAYSVEECFALVEAQERNNVPFMLLENCCYDKNEMLVMNMVKEGLFGEIVHCHGSYAHDLRDEVSGGKENRHYRLEEYLNRNCENYPTHELGPIAKILGINRGNRMTRLVSMSSKAAGLKRYIDDRKDTIVNKDLIGAEFKQGDIVETLITCANGETISLKLDTTLPRPYSREFTVRGTKGLYEEQTNHVFLDGENHWIGVRDKNNARKYDEKYLPDCWKQVTDEILNAGHGGMDYFEFEAFFDALINGKPTPIDVYDAAAWMCISCLSEKSIEDGNMPVEIPDFTHGMWKDRK